MLKWRWPNLDSWLVTLLMTSLIPWTLTMAKTLVTNSQYHMNGLDWCQHSTMKEFGLCSTAGALKLGDMLKWRWINLGFWLETFIGSCDPPCVVFDWNGHDHGEVKDDGHEYLASMSTDRGNNVVIFRFLKSSCNLLLIQDFQNVI